MELYDTKIPIDDLLKKRPGVLDTWVTGKDVADIDKSVAYLEQLPASKHFATALARAEGDGRILMQPRAGVCLLKDHILLLQHLSKEGGADLLPTTIDSYTRQNRYEEAWHGVEESLRVGRSLLNGFPAVNYGHLACRDIIEAVDKPVQVRHGTPDARLLCEIALAGGFTAFEGGGISYNIPYAKKVPLKMSLIWWQYVDRLVGHYAERGVVINREPFGPLTGTLVPPSISNAIAIAEALLAAQQGVLDITVGYGQCGNLNQDVAALASLRALCEEYLARGGYDGVKLSTVFHQWMGGFPQDESSAFGVISWGAVGAALSGATKVITKSPHEAIGVPSAESNTSGLRATRQILNMLDGQAPFSTPAIEREVEVVGRETRAILDGTFRLGEGELARGVVRAFEAGVMDVPFAPSQMTRGAVMPVRDLSGAVRYFEFGSLPFDDEMKEFHRALLKERSEEEGRPVSFQMVTDDIYAVSKGRLVGRPRS
jgi:methylaspartate mutase epsilon subunit